MEVQRKLDQQEIALITRIEAIGREFENLIDAVDEHLREQMADAFTLQANRNDEREGTTEINRIDYAEPRRWRAKAKSSVQDGLMFLTRAVAQPTTY